MSAMWKGGKVEWISCNLFIPATLSPVEWLRKVRNDDKLTLDDVETIDLLLAW